jgi:hypothetical protein
VSHLFHSQQLSDFPPLALCSAGYAYSNPSNLSADHSKLFAINHYLFEFWFFPVQAAWEDASDDAHPEIS